MQVCFFHKDGQWTRPAKRLQVPHNPGPLFAGLAVFTHACCHLHLRGAFHRDNFLNNPPKCAQFSKTARAWGLEVCWRCRLRSWTTSEAASASRAEFLTNSRLSREVNCPASSSTYAAPPVMPAPKFRPVGPNTTTRPPVIYSQP